jgi:hypothetical protein
LVRMRRRKPWVLARLRLLGWYVRFNAEPPRGGRARPEVGDHAGGGNQQVYGSGGPRRNAERSLGKTPATPCRTRTPVLRCALRPATVPPGGLPTNITARTRPTLGAPLPRSPHLWTLLWTTPATADAPGSGKPLAAGWRSREER